MQADQDQSQTPRTCPRHPTEETYLSCSHCGEPVCPRCMVYAPVGIRCPNCAQSTRVPTYDVRGMQLAVAGALGGILALVGAALWIFLPFLLGQLRLGIFSFMIMMGFGFLVARILSRAVNEKRGRSMQIVAGTSVGLGFAIAVVFAPFLLNAIAIFSVILAIVAAVSTLK